MTFMFLVRFASLLPLLVPLSISSVLPSSLWFPCTTPFSTPAVLITLSATAVFSAPILLGLFQWVLPIVALWRLWALVMLSLGILLVTDRLPSLCVAVFTRRMRPSACCLWVPLSSVGCLVCSHLEVLQRCSILVTILSSLALPFRLLSPTVSLFFGWILSLR